MRPSYLQQRSQHSANRPYPNHSYSRHFDLRPTQSKNKRSTRFADAETPTKSAQAVTVSAHTKEINLKEPVEVQPK
jgi:hypothetical protein